MGIFEVFRVRDNDNAQRGGRVVHATTDSDAASDLRIKLQGQRPAGSSTWYGVRAR